MSLSLVSWPVQWLNAHKQLVLSPFSWILASCLGHKSKREKTRSATYNTDLELGQQEICILLKRQTWMEGLWTDCPGTPGRVDTEREEPVDTTDKFLSVSGFAVCLPGNRAADVLVPTVGCTLPWSAVNEDEAWSLLNKERSSAVSPM